MSVETKYCYACDKYSCESMLLKTGDGVYIEDPNRRFRFEKDENACIFNGGIVPRSIQNCEYKSNPQFYDPPLPRSKKNEKGQTLPRARKVKVKIDSAEYHPGRRRRKTLRDRAARNQTLT